VITRPPKWAGNATQLVRSTECSQGGNFKFIPGPIRGPPVISGSPMATCRSHKQLPPEWRHRERPFHSACGHHNAPDPIRIDRRRMERTLADRRFQPLAPFFASCFGFFLFFLSFFWLLFPLPIVRLPRRIRNSPRRAQCARPADCSLIKDRRPAGRRAFFIIKRTVRQSTMYRNTVRQSTLYQNTVRQIRLR
jgi:hypothetical protein